MTKLEAAIRMVSDLREFYLQISKKRGKGQKTGATRRSRRPAKPAAAR